MAANQTSHGMQIADAWIRCGMYKRVALVGGEVHSTALDFSDEGRDVTVLFGDGAGAAIVGPSPDAERGVLDSRLHSEGKHAKEYRALVDSAAATLAGD